MNKINQAERKKGDAKASPYCFCLKFNRFKIMNSKTIFITNNANINIRLCPKVTG